MATNANLMVKTHDRNLYFHFRYDGYREGMAKYLYNAIKANKDVSEDRSTPFENLVVAGNPTMIHFGKDKAETDCFYRVNPKKNRINEEKLTDFVNKYSEKIKQKTEYVIVVRIFNEPVYIVRSEAESFRGRLLTKAYRWGDKNPNTPRVIEIVKQIDQGLGEFND